jgi:hypothetical protein
MTDNIGRNASTAGPAVIFEPAVLRSWLAEHSRVAATLGIDEFFGGNDGRLLSMLNDLLTAVTDEDQTGWRLQPGVERLGFLRTADGGIVVVDLDAGLRLAGSVLHSRDVVRLDSHGVEAAIQAMSTVAVLANSVVAAYHRTTNTDGQLTDRDVRVYGLTEAQFRELETAIGLPRYGLGRFKEWSAPRGVDLSARYDLDAAIRYARRTGLAYRETREVHHRPNPRPRCPGVDREQP